MMRLILMFSSSVIMAACGNGSPSASLPSSSGHSPGGSITYQEEFTVSGGDGSLAKILSDRMTTLHYAADARINCSEAADITSCVVKDASKGAPAYQMEGMTVIGLAVGPFVNESSSTVLWRSLSPLGVVIPVVPQYPQGQRRLTFQAGPETIKCLYVPSGLLAEHVMCSYTGPTVAPTQ